MNNIMEKLANELVRLKENIILVYAFNGVGKTRLSVAYKDVTKNSDGAHAGVYYNAYSEDLFVWDNDNENGGENIRLTIHDSSLNLYHALLDEDKLRDKLAAYKPKFDFRFNFYDNVEKGIEFIQFYVKPDKTSQESSELEESLEDQNINNQPIKISRGEEQVFIWCLFLTLFDIQGWTGEGHQAKHFFIDDPVSSIDDNNIFITATSIMDLIERHCKNRKIIITTHHIGFFSILYDWLNKGEKSSAYKKQLKTYILKKDKSEIKFESPKNDVFLHHLELLQTLQKVIDDKTIYAYHFVLLRQTLENISSFLGVGHFSYVLKQIGFQENDEIAQIVNVLSHKNVFRYEAKVLVPDNERLFIDIFKRIQDKYNFILHANTKP